MPKDPWDTPAMRQYRRFKQEHPGCLLFFRMGDFYEMFGDDAVTVGKDLGLTVSSRSSPIPMAGVPHHQKDKYVRLAVELGHRVAIVDQLEDPAQAKGVVERGVTQVITAGTLVDESLLADDAVCALAAVAFDTDDHAGAAVVDPSTGAFTVLDAAPDRLADRLVALGARELLFAEPADGSAPPRVRALADPHRLATTGRPAWHFGPTEAMEAIREQFAVAGVEGFGLDEGAPSTRAAGAVIRYLRETQAVDREPTAATSGSEFQRQRATLAHLRAPVRESPVGVCLLDTTSLRALEVERTIRPAGADPIEGSLLGVFLRARTGPRCVVRTPMGKRLIREWLCRPLADVDAIRARQHAVRSLHDEVMLAGALGERLEGMSDVARIAGRLALGRATPRDLVALGASAARLAEIAASIDQCDALRAHRERLLACAAAITPIASAIESACVDDPPPHLREGGLIRDGFDAEVDEARSLQRDAGKWLADYQTKLIAEHDLPSLKVGFNKVFGYFIELPAAQARRAPDVFTRKQTLKNAERYLTPELKTFEEKVTTAESRAIDRERSLFDDLCERARAQLAALGAYADVLAELDVLLAFADKARRRGWVMPEVVDDPTLSIHAGRHPVLDEQLERAFVPNDCELATPDARATLALITGPNMAGKSTYIRQNALLAVLALTGSFIPADRATIGVCDRIFTRVGADDALHRGQSTFMVEMTETATILNNAGARSLVVLDEIGRGTSTLDGLSLAWAIAEWLGGDDKRPGPRTLFATHYHELTELAERAPDRVRNLRVAVDEWTNADGRAEIVFLHRIGPGRADRSYGVHVARLAGVPAPVTDRADEVLESLSVHHGPGVAPKVPAGARKPVRDDGQLGLFAAPAPHPAVDRLREIKIEALSPLEAFDELRRLAAMLERGRQDAGA
ncbi:MAG: DNA mismatch repair protein MutS [Phycisphaerales bacterium]